MSDEPTTRGTSGNGVPAFLKNPRVWVGLIIAVLAIAFIAQNRDPVQFDVLMISFQAPQWIMLTAIFLAGLITGALLRRKAKARKK